MIIVVERLYNNRINSRNQVQRLTLRSIGALMRVDLMTSGNRRGSAKEKPSRATAIAARATARDIETNA